MSDNVTIRKLKNNADDYKLLEKWYQKKEIYSQFEQRVLNYDEIKIKYYPRTKEDSDTPVYIIEYRYKPVGIIQYKLVTDDNKKLYNLNYDNIYELDIFIGEVDLHNKGIGRKSIEILSNYLFNEKSAEVLVMCPLKNNNNAIKCYEKCGFTINKFFKTNDTIGNLHEYILMIKNKKIDKWQFGIKNDELIKLVLSERKTATSYPYHNDSDIPIVGEETIILYDNKIEACKIRTIKYIVLKFKEMTEELAKLEGEGDLSLSYWKREHMTYFKSLDKKFNENSKIIFEIFDLIEIITEENNECRN